LSRNDEQDRKIGKLNNRISAQDASVHAQDAKINLQAVIITGLNKRLDTKYAEIATFRQENFHLKNPI
jgi:hypothetical protein